MTHLVKVMAILTVTIYTVRPLAIEHPHSFSLFKRGVVLGDLTYSYASTDMGSSNGGRVKTVTVIKNVSIPKPTSTMFSDRTEHFFDEFDMTGHKKQQEHVQYWPSDDTNKLKKMALKPPLFNIPEIRKTPQEEFKHPADLLEIAKSAAKTQSQILKNHNLANGDTGPVMFPPDAQMMKKKNNGVISVAKEYTSILTSTPKDRSKAKTASKLSTKVEPAKNKEKQPDSYNTFDPSSLYHQDDFEQREYVYSPESKTFSFKQASKPSTELKDKLKNTPYAFKDPSAPSTIDFTMYSDNSTTPDLLFSELANAVATRNVSMIKSLAQQLEESSYDGPKFDFESLKTDEYIPLSFNFDSPSVKKDPMPETTTMEMMKMDISDDFSTTVEPPTPTTKKPSKYIAPRLRGFKRFSSRRQ
ncbi:uncharacterized protein LOC135709813 [Ochlerotatus camptorhynchus]|uniref:uncharacterized protein LOC135709813 n=1 Tax=Ochlerotatus camptorhynchus TaxID=644619 RepID=UPI0031E48130